MSERVSYFGSTALYLSHEFSNETRKKVSTYSCAKKIKELTRIGYDDRIPTWEIAQIGVLTFPLLALCHSSNPLLVNSSLSTQAYAKNVKREGARSV